MALSKENLGDVLTAARAHNPDIYERDVVFLLACDGAAPDLLPVVYRCLYSGSCEGQDLTDFMETGRMKVLADTLEPFGVGRKEGAAITREENQREMERLIVRFEAAIDDKKIDIASGLKEIKDIRTKLQDKFDMDDNGAESKHLIVVPQKHDFVCPSTHMECSRMPTKEACMEMYPELVERKDK